MRLVRSMRSPWCARAGPLWLLVQKQAQFLGSLFSEVVGVGLLDNFEDEALLLDGDS